MPRAVLDPNVLISALITPHGTTGTLLVASKEGAFELVVSPHLMDEVRTTLMREKFRRYATLAEVEEYVDLLIRLAVRMDDPLPTGQPISEDPDDEYLAALAREARVDALVSGDPHLLKLRGLIPVRTPREFLEEIQQRG